jgi:molybdopterin-guanine dinucleotide biosynthesis adapter protein
MYMDTLNMLTRVEWQTSLIRRFSQSITKKKRSNVKLKLKSFHHIVDDQNRIVMAEGRMALLEAIVETGSINQAAKQMGMSYKTAWSKLHSTQTHLMTKVVHSDKADGTRLTRAGKKLLNTYKQMKRQCICADDTIFDTHFALDGERLEKQSADIPHLISFAGHSGSGKTTFIEKLIPIFTREGIKIAIIKHDVHGFEMDKPGKDTWRHKKAGAVATIISSSNQIGMVLDTNHDHQPFELAPLLASADLIIAEGYKKGPQPKIEVFRPAATGDDAPICQDDPQLVALISDIPVDLDLPVFGLEDIDSVANFIKRYFNLPPSGG